MTTPTCGAVHPEYGPPGCTLAPGHDGWHEAVNGCGSVLRWPTTLQANADSLSPAPWIRVRWFMLARGEPDEPGDS